MRLSRLLVLLTVLAYLCAGAQASIGEFAPAAKTAPRVIFAAPDCTSGDSAPASACRVWEKSSAAPRAASGPRNWTYDKVGNRLTQVVSVGAASAATTTTTAYAYDVNDRLLTEMTGGDVTSYAYDDNGNTLTKTSGADVVEYAYDDANRLVEMRKGGERVGYVYNADGLRVRETIAPVTGTPTTTYYVQDNAFAYAEVVEEWTQEGGGAKRLAASFAHADELISQTRYSATGEPTTSFVQTDGFGSTRWLTDASGAITDSIDYDAYGSETARSGTTNVEHLYRGERLDAGLAMYDLRARQYNPANGRFLTQDSFAGFSSDPRSLHKYLYANADPVNGRDPSGFMTLQEQTIASNLTATLQHLTRIGGSIMRAYRTFQSFKDVLETMQDIGRISSSLIYGGLRQNLADIGTSGMTFDPAKVGESLENNFSRVIGSGMIQWAKQLAMHRMNGRDIREFYIYMPVPKHFPAPRVEVPTGLEAGELPVRLIFGGSKKHHGRIVGVGVNISGVGESQLFRMDPGLHSPFHGNAAGTGAKPKPNVEADIWNDPPDFSYHVLFMR